MAIETRDTGFLEKFRHEAGRVYGFKATHAQSDRLPCVCHSTLRMPKEFHILPVAYLWIVTALDECDALLAARA